MWCSCKSSFVKHDLQTTPRFRIACSLTFIILYNTEIFYKDVKVGLHRLDFILDGKLVLELKAWASITSSHVGQTTAYLKTLKLHHGILVNFPYPEKDSADFKEIVL